MGHIRGHTYMTSTLMVREVVGQNVTIVHMGCMNWTWTREDRVQKSKNLRTSLKYGTLESTNDKCSRYPGFLQLLAPLVRALIFASLNAQRIIAAQIAATPIMAYFLKGERRRCKIK